MAFNAYAFSLEKCNLIEYITNSDILSVNKNAAAAVYAAAAYKMRRGAVKLPHIRPLAHCRPLFVCELRIVKFCVEAVLFNKLFVRALLDYVAFVHNKYKVGVLYG